MRFAPIIAAPLLLLAAPAGAEDPQPAPRPFHLQTTLDRQTPQPCTGPLDPANQRCTTAFRLSTTAAVVLLDVLLPVERRLTPFGGVLPPPGTRTDAPPGTWVTGFSSDPNFVGLGKFQMRDPH